MPCAGGCVGGSRGGLYPAPKVTRCGTYKASVNIVHSASVEAAWQGRWKRREIMGRRRSRGRGGGWVNGREVSDGIRVFVVDHASRWSIVFSRILQNITRVYDYYTINFTEWSKVERRHGHTRDTIYMYRQRSIGNTVESTKTRESQRTRFIVFSDDNSTRIARYFCQFYPAASTPWIEKMERKKNIKEEKEEEHRLNCSNYRPTEFPDRVERTREVKKEVASGAQSCPA